MPSDNLPTRISLTTGTIFRTVLVLILFAVLWYLSDVVLVVLAAIVIASAVEPITHWLGSRGVARIISVICTYALFAVAFVSFFYFFIPSLLSDTANFLRVAPSLLETMPASLSVPTADPSAVEHGALFAQTLSEGIHSAVTEPSSLTAVFTDLSQILSSFSKGFWDNISIAFGGFISFILMVVLSFYLAVQEDGVAAFLGVVTPQQYESYVVGLWRRAKRKIGLWIQGQILLAVLVGILVYLGLTVLGVKNALFLAALAALFETIPLFGPIISAIPGVMLAFASGTLIAPAGITSALLVAGLYLIIQQFENHLIYPLVVKKIVGVPPLLVILALIVGSKLGGFLGLLLSVPIAATLVEYLDDLQKRKSANIV